MRKLMFLLAATAIWPVAAQALAEPQDPPRRHWGDAQEQQDGGQRPDRGDRQRGGERPGGWVGGAPQARAESPNSPPIPNVQAVGGFQRHPDQGHAEVRRPPELEVQQGWADRQRQPGQEASPTSRGRADGGPNPAEWMARRYGGQPRSDGASTPDHQRDSTWQGRERQGDWQRQGQWHDRGQWQGGQRNGQWQGGHVALPPPNDGRIVQSRDRDHRWGRDWRQDRRYDWRDYRTQNRFVFRLGNYYDPYRYQYRRWQIGFNLWPAYYDRDFWLDDPWMWRLPPAYGPYRWVRYWDDALLVNIYTGQVVDVVYNVFW